MRNLISEIEYNRPLFSGANYPPMIVENESPETAIARQKPEKLLILLERESERKRYNEALAIGASIANTYISGLSSQNKFKINEISIEPIRQMRGVLGFFGNKGMVISFKKR